MKNNSNVSILLKNIIKSRFNSLSELSKLMGLNRSTVSKNLDNPTRKFLLRLVDAGVPIPDEILNPPVEKIKVKISSDGVQGFYISEPMEPYDEINIEDLRKKYKIALEEIIQLKSEIYDLKKQIEGLKNGE